MRIELSESGTPYSDFNLENVIIQKSLLNEDMIVSTQNVITAAQALKRQGKLDEVIIVYNGKDYEINKYGRIPRNIEIPDFFTDRLDILMDLDIYPKKRFRD